MMPIQGKEGEILRKYLKPRNIEDEPAEDQIWLDDLASVGLIHYGINLVENKRTAKTTELGHAAIL